MECSPAAVLHHVSGAFGLEVPHERLLGVCASAFRTYLFDDGWCPSVGHIAVGCNHVPLLQAAAPFETTIHQCEDKPANEQTAAIEAGIASVDRGIPACWGSDEDYLIVGYEPATRKLLLRVSVSRPPGFRVASGMPWGVGVAGSARDVDRAKIEHQSLRGAVRPRPGGLIRRD